MKIFKNEFIDGWCWAMSNPSHGDQGFIMNDEQREAVEAFTMFVQIRREYTLHEIIPGEPVVDPQL